MGQSTEDMRNILKLAGEVLDAAPPSFPLSPRGCSFDEGLGPVFQISVKEHVWAEGLTEICYESFENHWNPFRDIPWSQLKIAPLPDELELAVDRIMTSFTVNELVALYLPAKFLGRISPYYTEAILALASQLAEELRHVIVFTKRALEGKGLQKVSAQMRQAANSLVDLDDYPKAMFLLQVLGEGNFDALLKFLHEHAPETTLKEIARRVIQDEARHVKHGVLRAREQLRRNRDYAKELFKAAEERALFLRSVSTLDEPDIQEAYAIVAGGGSSPLQIDRGAQRFKSLQEEMHITRVNRLRSIGFDLTTAQKISELHGGVLKAFM